MQCKQDQRDSYLSTGCQGRAWRTGCLPLPSFNLSLSLLEDKSPIVNVNQQQHKHREDKENWKKEKKKEKNKNKKKKPSYSIIFNNILKVDYVWQRFLPLVPCYQWKLSLILNPQRTFSTIYCKLHPKKKISLTFSFLLSLFVCLFFNVHRLKRPLLLFLPNLVAISVSN